jgi:uncharacterized DUF497 family protein
MTQDVTTKYDGMWIDRLNQVYVTVCIFVCTMSRMAIEWDPEKAAANLRQHGVDFADAVGVFEDPYALTREDPDAQGEQRFVSVGLDFLGRVLTMVYTHRGVRTRLISARRATKREREAYERARS